MRAGAKLGLGLQTGSAVHQNPMGLGRLSFLGATALIEINPLVITKQGDLIGLDGNRADGNALFRQPDLREMRDQSQGRSA